MKLFPDLNHAPVRASGPKKAIRHRMILSMMKGKARPKEPVTSSKNFTKAPLYAPARRARDKAIKNDQTTAGDRSAFNTYSDFGQVHQQLKA